jgi:glycosyltransferase involved in cell wall biosynthesis
MKSVTIIVGGRWHAFDLARELAKTGYLNRLITNYPTYKVQKWGVPHKSIISLPASMILEQIIRRSILPGGWSRWQYRVHMIFARKAVQYLGESDIIHAWSSFALPSFLKARQGRRSVRLILERGSSHIEEQTRVLQKEQSIYRQSGVITHPFIRKMECEEYEIADNIAIPSTYVQSTFRQWGVPQEKLWLNPLGVDKKMFQKGVKTKKAFRIIFAGSLTLRKGVGYLCEAFRLARIPGSELFLVGGSSTETALLLSGDSAGIHVHKHVSQPELAALYQQASVFAIASVEEGMAMVQAQALACGLPLVCTKNTGGEDLLARGGQAAYNLGPEIAEYPGGYVVPIRDPASMAKCFRALALNESLWIQKCRSATMLVDGDLDWSSYAKRNIELYERT